MPCSLLNRHRGLVRCCAFYCRIFTIGKNCSVSGGKNTSADIVWKWNERERQDFRPVVLLVMDKHYRCRRISTSTSQATTRCLRGHWKMWAWLHPRPSEGVVRQTDPLRPVPETLQKFSSHTILSRTFSHQVCPSIGWYCFFCRAIFILQSVPVPPGIVILPFKYFICSTAALAAKDVVVVYVAFRRVRNCLE